MIRLYSGFKVTIDDVKQVIGQFGELKRFKKYALLLNRIERPVSFNFFSPADCEFSLLIRSLVKLLSRVKSA